MFSECIKYNKSHPSSCCTQLSHSQHDVCLCITQREPTNETRCSHVNILIVLHMVTLVSYIYSRAYQTNHRWPIGKHDPEAFGQQNWSLTILTWGWINSNVVTPNTINFLNLVWYICKLSWACCSRSAMYASSVVPGLQYLHCKEH